MIFLLVLERWGAWAAMDSSGVDYSHIAVRVQRTTPSNWQNTAICCTDDDALIIEGCMAKLRGKKPYEHSLLVAHYLFIFGISKRKLAKALKKDEKVIRIEIQMAEGFVDGCLAMLDLRLDMDIEVKS
ncbi:antitermination protein Q [Klebsiella pneumoniae subsp. pneumoniae]|nr:antitermination protein Q [Klebsiella pneumoniae subsp. pneumoniae]